MAHPTWFKSRIKKPAVIEAILDLGRCLDLTEATSLEVVRSSHDSLQKIFTQAGAPLPRNQQGAQGDADLVKRHLDCAVINHVHELREESGAEPYDSVRGVFLEGEALYPGGRIIAKKHTQISIRHPGSIRGYFRPIPENR